MANPISADDSFLAFGFPRYTANEGERGFIGEQFFLPGEKRYVPQINSHSLNFETTRQERTWVNGRRTLSDSIELNGTVSGDVVMPLQWGDTCDNMMAMVLKSRWGMSVTNSFTPNDRQMVVGNADRWSAVIETVNWANPTAEVTQRFMACQFTSFGINIAPQNVATITGSVMGRELNKELSGDRKKISFDKQSSAVYIRQTSPPIPGRNYTIVIRDPEQSGTIGDYCFTSADLNAVTDAEQRFCIGSRGATGIRMGGFNVTLDLSLYTHVHTSRLWQRFRDDRPLDVELRYTGNGRGFTFRLPYCRIQSMTAPIGGPNSDVMTNLSLVGTDSRWKTPLVITKMDYTT